jgi:heme-degrading monooxygenase HmoA
MFARMHTLETTPEQHDQGLEIVREQLLPWLRDSTGFRGLVRLADSERGKTIVITLWADEQALRGSDEAGRRLSELTAATVGVSKRELEEFEVTLFDVDG